MRRSLLSALLLALCCGPTTAQECQYACGEPIKSQHSKTRQMMDKIKRLAQPSKVFSRKPIIDGNVSLVSHEEAVEETVPPTRPIRRNSRRASERISAVANRVEQPTSAPKQNTVRFTDYVEDGPIRDPAVSHQSWEPIAEVKAIDETAADNYEEPARLRIDQRQQASLQRVNDYRKHTSKFSKNARQLSQAELLELARSKRSKRWPWQR